MCVYMCNVCIRVRNCIDMRDQRLKMTAEQQQTCAGYFYFTLECPAKCPDTTSFYPGMIPGQASKLKVLDTRTLIGTLFRVFRAVIAGETSTTEGAVAIRWSSTR